MQVAAEFKIHYTQYLNESGEASGELPACAGDPELLIDLYRTMVKVRVFDTKGIALQRTGRMGTYAPVLGQEAIGTAIGKAMQADDVLVPFYRDYCAQLQRGASMSDIYRYWGGDERGSDFTNNREDFPICVPIASQCLHAAGVASAFKMRSQKRVAVTTLGDGGTSEGDFYEAMNAAGAWQLPLVIVVNNNQWAISVPLKKQTNCQTLAQKAIAAGIHGEQVDGNDALATYDRIKQAIERARNGEGPSLIEAISYRLSDHTTADDASRYRDDEELQQAWQREPIARLRNYLLQKNWWDENQEKALQANAKQMVEEAVKDYEATPPQKISDIFDYHYAQLPDDLIEQRKQAQEN